jgi:hypothetical protein
MSLIPWEDFNFLRFYELTTFELPKLSLEPFLGGGAMWLYAIS